MIDLRSDTVTKPSPAMLDAMMKAEVGDDVFAEDPTINALQDKLAKYFGKEAGLFCPSGTMTNQIAIQVHTQPGDEVICSRLAHIYLYEGGGIAKNSGASVRLLEGPRGLINAAEVGANINPPDSHYPRTSLVSVEDTCNKGGGSCYEFTELKAISELAKRNGLKYHLDGARVFNAIVAKGHEPKAYGALFDSISVCLSKGLGAPVGSVLLGSRSFIERAHRSRKAMGGGMRQAGILAAAGIYALDHHVEELATDHKKAAQLAQTLELCTFVKEVTPPETNILIIKLKESWHSAELTERLKASGILAIPFGPEMLRFVTHRDVSEAQINQACEILQRLD